MKIDKKLKFLKNLMMSGYNDFELAYATLSDEGVPIWSKWRSYMELMFLSDKKKVEFIEKANNRTILKNEIVLDVDENPTIEKFNKICDSLDKRGYSYKGYFTGSKGYHIHVNDDMLLSFGRVARETMKLNLIRKYGCDEQKAHERCMIALEHAPHWKTGKRKKLLRCSKNEFR